MQIFNYNIDEFIAKINFYVTIIISFCKVRFNTIIALQDVDFSLGNILNSTGIIIQFILTIFYFLIFITVLAFVVSPIFNIIKIIIKLIFKIIKLPFKLIIKLIKIFNKSKLLIKPSVKSSIKTNIPDKTDLIKLQKKISELEYKLNLQQKRNNQNYKQSR
ncbi:hypothetical protein J8J04_02665 ['Fragaria x ananassa' phyllody phytoplasma]|uniref:Uncharacterized protein n=2 Tax='Fragaria x ananassa' phyllody phytoplasma TaxID=2358428 RepID=A0ABS5K589_9MOLU|nr:hypothetical protein ['Fragaria x ananassa' phyllody phytoplasma]MBS2126575.1 hypothetical protein ['Fragaria x ananassa' phyllody phytoplasma]